MSDIPLVTYSVELLEATINKQVARIEALEAALQQSVDDWRERGRRIEQLEAALREIIEPVYIGEGGYRVKEIARAALDQSSPPARQENDDVFKGFRGNNDAA